MTIEKLKYYIDLVECRNFTETAKKNFVSQTTISQQIASLEAQYGLTFIDRKHIPIEPTQAGWLFYKEALVIYKQYLSMNQRMEWFKKDESSLLTIEYASTTDVTSLIDIMPDFLKAHPKVKVELNKVALNEISSGLTKGIYDMAVSFDSEFLNQEQIHTRTLHEGGYCAVVGENHPLFHQDAVEMETLYTYPMVMLNPQRIGHSYDLMVSRAHAEGFQPMIKKLADDVESELFYIITESLIGFFPELYEFSPLEAKKLKKLTMVNSAHRYRIQVGYFPQNQNPALRAFLDFLDHYKKES